MITGPGLSCIEKDLKTTLTTIPERLFLQTQYHTAICFLKDKLNFRNFVVKKENFIILKTRFPNSYFSRQVGKKSEIYSLYIDKHINIYFLINYHITHDNISILIICL